MSVEHVTHVTGAESTGDAMFSIRAVADSTSVRNDVLDDRKLNQRVKVCVFVVDL